MIPMLGMKKGNHPVPWCVLAAGVSGLGLVAVVSGSPYKGTEGGATSCVT